MVLDAEATARLAGVGVVAVVGALAAVVSRKLRLPTVVGFLAGGFVAGPVLGVLRPDPLLEALGDFGVALLLFLVGIDISVDEARTVGPPALVATLAQLLASAAGGYAMARLLGFDAGTALFLAVALSFSSTVVVVKVLMDLGDLGATYGRLAVGVFLWQDVVVVVLLSVLPAVGGGAADAPGGLLLAGAIAVGQMLLLGALAVVASRTLLPFAFSYAAGAPGFAFLFGLAWLFLGVAASQLLAVSVEVGAFVAGLSLAPLPMAAELRRRTRPLLDLFVALFFVTLASGVDLAQAARLLGGALAFSAFVVLGKAVILTGVLVRMGYPRETSLRTGITVGQVSEFGIVLAALALGQGLVDETARDFVILVAMLTITASGALIWNSARLSAWLERVPLWRKVPSGARETARPEQPPRGHVLLVGWDGLAERLARPALAAGAQVVALSARGTTPEGLDETGVVHRYGDPADPAAAEAANLREARLVLVHVEDPDVPHALAMLPDAPPVVAVVHDEEAARRLEEAGVRVIHPERLIAEEAARATREEAGAGG